MRRRQQRPGRKRSSMPPRWCRHAAEQHAGASASSVSVPSGKPSYWSSVNFRFVSIFLPTCIQDPQLPQTRFARCFHASTLLNCSEAHWMNCPVQWLPFFLKSSCHRFGTLRGPSTQGHRSVEKQVRVERCLAQNLSFHYMMLRTLESLVF